jgi:hypothetical protein
MPRLCWALRAPHWVPSCWRQPSAAFHGRAAYNGAMSEGPERPWYQLSLRSILFLGVPCAGMLAWIVALDGPWIDPRRVCSHKLGLVILLANAAFVIWLLRMWTRSPPQFQAYRRISIVMLSLWLIAVAFLAVIILRNRQQGIEREAEQSPLSAPVNSRESSDWTE